MRERLIGRLRYLRNLEIWNIISIPTILIIVITQLMIFEWQMMVYNIIIMTFMFLQGAIYWDIKHSSLIQKQSRLPDSFRTNFRTLRWFNVVLLCAYPAMSFYGTYSGNLFFATSWWSHSIFLAAIIVHVNYYHVQISHDNPTDMRYLVTHQKLRRSPLHTDLYPLSVTISSPIRQVRKSVASASFGTGSMSKHAFSTTTQSASTPTTAPSIASSQSQPLPTSKSQPLPTLPSSQSQPLPLYANYDVNASDSAKTQPLPVLDEATILNIVLKAPQSAAAEPVINDNQLAQEYNKQQTNKKQRSSTPDSSNEVNEETTSQRFAASTKSKTSSKKSTSARSRQKPTNE